MVLTLGALVLTVGFGRKVAAKLQSVSGQGVRGEGVLVLAGVGASARVYAMRWLVLTLGTFVLTSGALVLTVGALVPAARHVPMQGTSAAIGREMWYGSIVHNQLHFQYSSYQECGCVHLISHCVRQVAQGRALVTRRQFMEEEEIDQLVVAR
eukprot:3941559-Rhodomonas_salina.1